MRRRRSPCARSRASTIIAGVDDRDPAALVAFYEYTYSHRPAQAERYGRWRALGAVGKAEHVLALCERADLWDARPGHPINTLDVGCGDGALLSELHRRGFGGRLSGLEISEAAVAIAGARAEIDAVERYDGAHVPAA